MRPNDPGCRRARRHRGDCRLPRAIATLPVLRNAHCQRSFDAPCCAAAIYLGAAFEPRRTRLRKPNAPAKFFSPARRPICAKGSASTADCRRRKSKRSSTPPTALRGSPPTSRRSRRWPPTPGAWARKGDLARPRSSSHDRPRRIPRPDFWRLGDEPGRNRAPCRFRLGRRFRRRHKRPAPSRR